MGDFCLIQKTSFGRQPIHFYSILLLYQTAPHYLFIITLQIIFKLSEKHSMCQAGESPDNECQYHYHNFNVAIFHPLTTQTFVF